MVDLLRKFTEAAKAVSSNNAVNWEFVNRAYMVHLSDICTDSLPEKLKIIFESVKLRLSTGNIIGTINDTEANYIAQDIVYMADVICSGNTMPLNKFPIPLTDKRGPFRDDFLKNGHGFIGMAEGRASIDALEFSRPIPAPIP